MSSTTDTVTVCPECGTADINRRAIEKPGRPRNAPDKRYWCTACQHGFDEPAEREREVDYNTGGGLGVSEAQLDAARESLGIEVDGDG